MNYVSRNVSAEIIGGLKLHILSLTRELEVGEWREANLQTFNTAIQYKTESISPTLQFLFNCQDN